jgi:hypothetical protein
MKHATTLHAATITIVVAAAGCGGSRAPDSPGAPTPAVHQLASLQEQGRLDPSRLACSAITLDLAAQELGPLLPGLYNPATRPVEEPTSSHARDVQRGMAASDSRSASMRIASQARVTAAQAAAAGDQYRAVRASSYAAEALSDAGVLFTDLPPLPPVVVPPSGWSEEDSALLVEYASLWATIFVAEPGTDEAERARVVRISESSPAIMEAYANLLLYTYRDPELVCAG